MIPDPGALDAMVLAWLALQLAGLSAPRCPDRPPPAFDRFSMLAMRKVWMHGMLHRDFRVPDTMLMGQVIQSVAFFASGTIIDRRGSTGWCARAGRQPRRLLRGVRAGRADFAGKHPAGAARPARHLHLRFLHVHLDAPAVQLLHRDDRSGTDATHRDRAPLAACRRSGPFHNRSDVKLQCRPAMLLLRLRHAGLVPPPAARAGNDSLDHDHADPSAVLFGAAANIAAVLAEYSLADLPNPSRLKRLL